MGVNGLFKYIRSSNSSIKLESIELFKDREAKQLVCDMIAVFYWLIKLLHKAKVSSKEYSPYAAIYGGNFKDYTNRILEFVKVLRHINVEPIFFMDGPQGSDCDYEMKMGTWEERSRKILYAVKRNAEICKFHATEIKVNRIKQTLLFDELVSALRAAQVTVIICEGEADQMMAEYSREHKDVVGILTNDSDMALMSGCKMIHYKFFDRKDVLQLYRPTLKMSHGICCDVLKQETLARDLKIDEKCLPALSILCGNDFTDIFNKEYDIQEKLGFKHPFVSNISVWIKHHEKDCMSVDTFVEITQIKEICQEHPEYLKAIVHSYNFYQSGSKIVRTTRPESPLHIMVTTEVQNHKISREFMAFTKTGVVWRNEIEQLDERMTCIHKILEPVRRLIYRLLCIRNISEYGQLNVNRFVKERIRLCPYKEHTMHSLRRLSFNAKPIVVFNALLYCSLEFPSYHMDDSDMVVRCSGETEDHLHASLTCTCLSFAIKNRVIINPHYVTPVVLACFCCALDITPPKLAARPGPTGVTIASQFMVILQHARWIASLLGLHEQLPLPSTIFQPFVYIPLHGTAFKFAQKEKFHGEDMRIKEFYCNICSGKEFIKFENLIKRLSCVEIRDIFPTVVFQYINTKKDILTQLDSSSKPLKKK